MSYVVQSSENTIKVVLNSQLATNGTVKQPRFTLRTPITTPYNQTGLVCLESIALRAPSMYTRNILNDRNNSIYENTYTDPADAELLTYDGDTAADTGPLLGGYGTSWFTADGVEEAKEGQVPEPNEAAPVPEPVPNPKAADIHKSNINLPQYNTGSNLYFAGSSLPYGMFDEHSYCNRDTVVAGLSNTYSMRSILYGAVHQDMTSAVNIANLLMSIVEKFKIFEIILPSLNHGVTITGTNSNITSNDIQNVTLSYNGAAVVFKVNDVVNGSFDIYELVRMITNSNLVRFYLQPQSTNTKNYVLQGPWLKLLGVSMADDYVAFNTKFPLLCTLQTGGYDFINMHTNFSRAVYAANQQSDDWQLVPTNIFWPLNIVSDPGKYTYYDNMSSSGKIPYNTPIMEEIEVYFTDKYGDVIDDIEEFCCILTFDFSDKVPAKEPLTSKRARRTLALF